MFTTGIINDKYVFISSFWYILATESNLRISEC